MGTPEIQRQVRQQRADIDSLYELVQRVDLKINEVDQKVDALDRKVDAGFADLGSKLDAVLEQLRGR